MVARPGAGSLLSVVPDPSGAPNRVLRLASPAHTDATVVRSSVPLPEKYRISLRVGFASFSDGKPGLNGYSDWIHHHRKVVIDSDNNTPPWMQMWNGTSFEWNGQNPIVVIALDGAAPIISGRFRYGGERTYTAEIDLAANCVWHLNRTPAEARPACDGPEWPPGSSFPDWFMFGDPHDNYYEGSVDYDDLKLETWTE